MIVRLLWFAGVFCLFDWIGAHWGAYPAVVLPFDPAATIARPFHELSLVLKG
jgi:hypothetical protein